MRTEQIITKIKAVDWTPTVRDGLKYVVDALEDGERQIAYKMLNVIRRQAFYADSTDFNNLNEINKCFLYD